MEWVRSLCYIHRRFKLKSWCLEGDVTLTINESLFICTDRISRVSNRSDFLDYHQYNADDTYQHTKTVATWLVRVTKSFPSEDTIAFGKIGAKPIWSIALRITYICMYDRQQSHTSKWSIVHTKGEGKFDGSKIGRWASGTSATGNCFVWAKLGQVLTPEHNWWLSLPLHHHFRPSSWTVDLIKFENWPLVGRAATIHHVTRTQHLTHNGRRSMPRLQEQHCDIFTCWLRSHCLLLFVRNETRNRR